MSPALIMTSQASAQTPAAQPVGACTGPESASNFKCLEREVQAEFTFFEARFPVEAKLVKEEVAVEEQDAAAILSVIEADATR